VVRETRKYLSTLLSKGKNESASNNKNISQLEIDWFLNDEKLYERAVSVNSLKKAWFALRSIPGMSTRGTDDVTLNGINDSWFHNTSVKLLEGSFKYPNKKRVLIDQSDGSKRSFIIANPKVKIIEKALLSALEPQFEGHFVWESVNKKEYLRR
jgi:hypothetical protein